MSIDINEYLDFLERLKEGLNHRSFTEKESEVIFAAACKHFLENTSKTNLIKLSDNQSLLTGKAASFVNPNHTFAELVRKVKFKQHTDLALLALYYIINYKNVESATISDIENEYSSALLKNSSNTNANINVSRRKGFVMEAGKKDNKMAFKLTMSGMDHIEEAINNEG